MMRKMLASLILGVAILAGPPGVVQGQDTQPQFVADEILGVIDEGIDLNHPDLALNIWTDPFDPGDGVDNDGNGDVDDVSGWDFSQNNNSIYDGAPGDSTTDGFEIERCEGAGCTNFTAIAPVGDNVVSYSNTGPSASTVYRNRVRAFNGGGSSGYSNETEATTLAPEPPAAPSTQAAAPST